MRATITKLAGDLHATREQVAHHLRMRDDIIPKLTARLDSLVEERNKKDVAHKEELAEFQARHERSREVFKTRAEEKTAAAKVAAADHAMKTMPTDAKVRLIRMHM
jgi:hypothetical protein